MIPRSGISFYDNFEECIFALVPQIAYEAIKNYNKGLADPNIS